MSLLFTHVQNVLNFLINLNFKSDVRYTKTDSNPNKNRLSTGIS